MLSNYGATVADWDAHHVGDTRYDPTTAFDPTPGLGPDEQHDDAYYLVMVDAGRVDSYTKRMPHGVSITEARTLVLADMPPDTKTLWFVTKATCAQEELRSATLGRALADPAIGDGAGEVFVEFVTETAAGDSGYSASDANEALVGLGSYPKAAQAPDC